MIFSSSPNAQDGDLAELVGLRHKHFIITLKAGTEFQTHRGVLQHDDLIGKPWGSQVFSHLGAPFFLLQPSLAHLLKDGHALITQTSTLRRASRRARPT